MYAMHTAAAAWSRAAIHKTLLPFPAHCAPQLTLGPSAIRARFDTLAAVLPRPRARLEQAAARRPQLLGRSPVALARALAVLAGLTRLTLRDAAVMVAGEGKGMSRAMAQLRYGCKHTGCAWELCPGLFSDTLLH